MRCPHVEVAIDLGRIRSTAESIRARTGVKLMAVIKADAYGLGAVRVATALEDIADEFVYFSIQEARAVGRPGLVIGPPLGDPAEYRARELRPAIGNAADAERMRGLRVAISVDTGMGRFGCPPGKLDDLSARCEVEDYFTHATTREAAMKLRELCGHRGRPIHAAATDLLDQADCWLDAVRPGLALYRGAVRVTTRLHAVRSASGPIGYSGFRAERVGIILAGYSNSVKPGPIMVNGRRQQIVETGMNSSFVTVTPADKPGDEVLLLGNGLDEAELAAHFAVRPHEILCRYTSIGPRTYRTDT